MTKYVRIPEPLYEDAVVKYLVNLKTARGKEAITLFGKKEKIDDLIDKAEKGEMTQEDYDGILHRFAKPQRASQPFIDRMKKSEESRIEEICKNLRLSQHEKGDLSRLYQEFGGRSEQVQKFYRNYLDRIRPYLKKSLLRTLESAVEQKHFSPFTKEVAKLQYPLVDRLNYYRIHFSEEEKNNFLRDSKEGNLQGLLALANKWDKKRIYNQAAALLSKIYITNAQIVRGVGQDAKNSLSLEEIKSILNEKDTEGSYRKLKKLVEEILPFGEKALCSRDEKGNLLLDYQTINYFNNQLKELNTQLKRKEDEIKDY